MAARGLVYGPSFRVLGELYRGVNDCVATVTLPGSVVGEAGRYHLHPALGDALLQLMAGAVPLETDGSFSPYTYMPVGIRGVRIVSQIDDFTQPLFVYAERTSSESGPSPERVEANVALVSESGDIIVALEGVQVQRLGRSGGADSAVDTSRWLYRVAWEEQTLTPDRRDMSKPAASSASANGAWLVFADKRGVARQLSERLSSLGQSCILVEPGAKLALGQLSAGSATNGRRSQRATALIDPLDESHYRELIEIHFIRAGRACLGVVHFWSLDITEERPPSGAQRDATDVAWQHVRRLGCGSVLQLVRALSRTTFSKSPPLWLVTGGAQAVADGSESSTSPIDVYQAPLLGMGRVAAMELPDLRPRLIDVDLDPASDRIREAAAAVVAELFNDTSEGQIAYRDGKRYVARLVQDSSLAAEQTRGDAAELAVPNGSFQLRIRQAGSFDQLQFVPVEREPLAAGQVEIEVRATGLNFSDVLKALGLYPGIKDTIVPLGIEASGVVTAVGAGVDRFRPGDEVFGVVPYAFASHARTAEYALVHKPKSADHDQACTIPITFLTAYYGLVRLAQSQPGERVLVHAGAGGVGLAAIQIAQRIGAEVFATAGSETKREFLRSLGVQHVYSSRSTAFADEILADTDRQGVDVVLNSLPGEAISKSLSILRAYGRFLEIGKTDIYQNRMIGLLPFQDNLSYFAIDLDRMLRQRPEYIRELFADVMRHFESGEYRPLSFTGFEAPRTIDAFRYMSQRKNIGKVVVTMPSRESRAERQELDETTARGSLVRREGTYLITGGTGALGLRIAKWLAEQGAGTIALLSRRGAAPAIDAELAAIRTAGSSVIVVAGDVADADSLAAALAQIHTDCPPLRGVFHAAGVLADGILSDMTLEQLDRPMLPKVQGAWNLHSATLDAPLDFFVLFSSVASVLGSPGQANYAAGNAFLDALAHARRAQGLPAISVNWGPWAGSGMAAEAGRGEAVKSRGMALLEPEAALQILGKLLSGCAAQVAVMDARWDDMLRLFGARRPALLEQIAARQQDAASDKADNRIDHAFLRQLLDADEATRQSLTRDYIQQELARIMGIEPASLDVEQPLSTFGLDSLLALELKNNLEGRLDFTLPMAKLMEGPSIASLAGDTARLLAASETATGESAAAESEAWSPLLALRAEGERPPLILLPALGGDIRCYSDLVQELGEDQPVYAFRPRGVDQELPPHTTMDDMIRDYAAALRELQPSGPYYLAGWSAGGIFAFALAEALERDGDEIALLAMFDTPLPSICDELDLEDDARFLCDLVNFANRFSGADVRLNYSELAALAPAERFPTALAEARRRGLVPAETPESFIRRLVLVGEANVRVIQSYRPQAIAARVQFFVPTIKGGLAELSGRETSGEEDHGWSSQVRQSLDLHEVSGDHFTMMLGQTATTLARELAQGIAGWQAASPQSRSRRTGASSR
jgi:NADPH:quinone reductase-like Zn-dependent oxidoreductase/thioesterase domain-containing protein/acyl carrier protein